MAAPVADFKLLDSFERDEAHEFVADASVSVGDLLNKLSTDMAGNKDQDAVRIVHTIKGICANIGARRVPLLCDRFRGLPPLSSTEGKEQWEATRAALSDAFDEVLEAMRARYGAAFALYTKDEAPCEALRRRSTRTSEQ